MKPFHLLLVGREIKRKGVDIAIRVVQLLNEEGIPAELRIVGLSGKDIPYVRYMGAFNKTIEAELGTICRTISMGAFPDPSGPLRGGGHRTRGSGGIWDSHHYQYRAGGLATTVKHNVSGVVLPAKSLPEDYVTALKKYINDPAGLSDALQNLASEISKKS